MQTNFHLSLLLLLLYHLSSALRFMPETFKDITGICGREGRFPMFLDFTKPSVNLRLDEGQNLKRKNVYINRTLDCDIEIQTVLRRDRDKEMLEVEALSLLILELNYTHSRTESVQVITTSYFGTKTISVTQEASYGTSKIWANNPTFLLSGQLTGYDAVENNRHRARNFVHEQHVFPPDRIFSKFDTPASIQVRLRRWSLYSRLYLVFTSYRLLNNGEACAEGEFECPTSPSFRENTGRLCMSFSLACNGLPNCGDNQIPNPDESCYKIHWSSILMSLVSYILLAITLLLCMSCFARILIQWSVRSSLYDMRSDSVRSSSRFFSFFGGSFSRWERPPPTYDEALKHFNPDAGQRPPNPPPYSDTYSTRLPISRSLQAIRSSSLGSGIRTPPPDYASSEDLPPSRQYSSIERPESGLAQVPEKESGSTLPKYMTSGSPLPKYMTSGSTFPKYKTPVQSRVGESSFWLQTSLVQVEDTSSIQAEETASNLVQEITNPPSQEALVRQLSSELKVRKSGTLRAKADKTQSGPVVRTSQSGLLPGPSVTLDQEDTELSDLSPEALLTHNRTSKSGLLLNYPNYLDNCLSRSENFSSTLSSDRNYDTSQLDPLANMPDLPLTCGQQLISDHQLIPDQQLTPNQLLIPDHQLFTTLKSTDVTLSDEEKSKTKQKVEKTDINLKNLIVTSRKS